MRRAFQCGASGATGGLSASAWIAIGLLFTVAAPVLACSIPVFRYALERWTEDTYQAVIFHREPLLPDDLQQIETVQTAEDGSHANLNWRTIDLSAALTDEQRAFVALIPDDARLPTCALIAPRFKERRPVIWQGTLATAKSSEWLMSPARKTIADKLLAGDSVVWLIIADGNDAALGERIAALSSQLQTLGDELPLPQETDDPASELFSDVPLTLRFSVVTISPDDPAEQFLVRQLRTMAALSVANGPLAAPVFGRGRVLEVIALDDCEPPLVEDISRYLSGACSCQVKEQNPGFDLLMNVNWRNKLFGIETEPLTPPPAGQTRPTPELVPIP